MTRDQDIGAWIGLEQNIYGFEEILPLRMIAEAIDERCAACGLPMHDVGGYPYHPKPGEWPNWQLFYGVYLKIRELLPHFIILDGRQSINAVFIPNATNMYEEMQYSNFPLYFLEDYARLAEHNCELFPEIMESNEDRIKLNNWYRACKYWLDQMVAVNVSQYAYLSNTWTCEGGWDWERGYDGKTVLLRTFVNDTWLYDEDSAKSPDEAFEMMQMSSTNNVVASNNKKLSEFSWYAWFNYDGEKRIGRYYDREIWDYRIGEEFNEQTTMDCENFPGTIRFVNPSPLSGALHLVLKPIRRFELQEEIPGVVEYHTEDSGYPGYPEIVVTEDLVTYNNSYIYNTSLNGSLNDADLKTKIKREYPGYDPERSDVSSTTTYYCYDFDGTQLPKTDVEHDAIAGDTHYSNYYTRSGDAYIYDAAGPLSACYHDVSADFMEGYQIKDVTIYNGIEKPYWWSFNDFPSKIESGMQYYDYTRHCMYNVYTDQSIVAYIDYSESFKYKPIAE